MPVAGERHGRAARQQLDVLADPAAAPEPARSRRVGNEFEAPDADRGLGLVHFHRNVGRVEDRAEPFRAVLARAAAVAAVDDIVEDEGAVPAARAIVRPAHHRVAPVREARHRGLRAHLREGAAHHLEHPDLVDGAAAARGGVLRVEERSGARPDLDRPVHPFVLGEVWIGEHLDRESRVGARVVDVGVDARFHLVAAPRPVEDDRVSVHGDLHMEAKGLAGARVVVHEVLVRPGPVRKAGDELAHPGLRAVENGVDAGLHEVETVPGEEPRVALRRDRVGVSLGEEIAPHDVREADVAEDESQDVLPELAAPGDAHGEDAKPLLERLAHLHDLRPRHRSPHVDVVGDVDREPDEPLAREEGRGHEAVRVVSRTHEGIVEEDAVAGLEVLRGEVVEYVPRHVGHGAEMPRREIALRDEPPPGVEEPGGEVVPFAHRSRVGGVAEGGSHVVGDGDEPVPEDAQGDGIDVRCVSLRHRVDSLHPLASPDRTYTRFDALFHEARNAGKVRPREVFTASSPELDASPDRSPRGPAVDNPWSGPAYRWRRSSRVERSRRPAIILTMEAWNRPAASGCRACRRFNPSASRRNRTLGVSIRRLAVRGPSM